MASFWCVCSQTLIPSIGTWHKIFDSHKMWLSDSAFFLVLMVAGVNINHSPVV